MAVERKSHSVTLQAAGDRVDDPLPLRSLCLVGEGMNIGDRLTVEDTHGSIVADYYVDALVVNHEFIPQGHMWVRGLLVTRSPASGTYTIVARLC